MAELIAWLARQLVDEPGAVRVETEEREDATVLRLHVAPEDVGKVIGRQGRIARGLRTLVRAGAARSSRRMLLEIVEQSLVDDADRAADRDDELVEIGRVGRPHGLDGAFVVERPSADERRFAVGATLFVGGAPATVVLSRRAGGGRLAVKLDCPAERGAPLTVRRADLPELAPDRFYVFQLVGLEVIEEGGRPLGRVRDVVSGIANDNLELENGTLVPMVEDAIRSVELDARRIVVSQGFVE